MNCRAPRGVQEVAEPETDIANLADYMNDAQDRRSNVRAPALQHLLGLVSQDAIKDEDILEQILELSSACLNDSRDFSERILLVKIAASLVLNGHTEHDFIIEFGESLGKRLPDILVNVEAPAEFVDALLHAIVVSEALTENTIEAADNVLLSTWLISSVKLSKQLMSEAKIASAVRALSIIATRHEDATALAALLKQAATSCGSDPTLATVVVKSAGIAFENVGETDQLNPRFLDHFDESQMAGNREAKKEFASAARSVIQLMTEGELPSTKITLTHPGSHFSSVSEVEIKSVAKLAVLESIRALIGDQYYTAILTSGVLHEFFGLETENPQDRRGRRIRHAERGNGNERQKIIRSRDKSRGEARDRKHTDLEE